MASSLSSLNSLNIRNTNSRCVVEVLLEADEVVIQAIEAIFMLLLTLIHQMATMDLLKIKVTHPSIKERQLLIILITLLLDSIKFRAIKPRTSGKVTTTISTVDHHIRTIMAHHSNILHQCNTTQILPLYLRRTITQTMLRNNLDSTNLTSPPSLPSSMGRSNLRNFKIPNNHLPLVTVCHPINKLPSLGLVLRSKDHLSLSLTIGVVVAEVVLPPTVGEVTKLH